MERPEFEWGGSGLIQQEFRQLWTGPFPCISLTSTALPAFTSGDNSAIVATDTMKNTVYVMAKKCTEKLTIEEFGIVIGKHFVSTYPEVSAAKGR